MAGTNTARQIGIKTESEVRVVSINFTPLLDSGELLTGTPTVEEVESSDLSFANQAVSTAVLVINGQPGIVAGRAVQFKVSGGNAARGRYQIKVTCGTDATPAQTLIVNVELEVVTDS